MIDWIIVAGLYFINPTELPYKEEGLDSYVGYINNQLIKSDGYSQVEFNAYIPQKFHDKLSEMASRDNWSMTVNKTNGFYSWQECYHFTFTPMRTVSPFKVNFYDSKRNFLEFFKKKG